MSCIGEDVLSGGGVIMPPVVMDINSFTEGLEALDCGFWVIMCWGVVKGILDYVEVA